MTPEDDAPGAAEQCAEEDLERLIAASLHPHGSQKAGDTSSLKSELISNDGARRGVNAIWSFRFQDARLLAPGRRSNQAGAPRNIQAGLPLQRGGFKLTDARITRDV